MNYNPQTSAIAIRLVQEALNEIDMLQWTTVACTYIEDDNLQLTISSPEIKRPVVIGLATFKDVPPYKAEIAMRPMIAGALMKAVKETM